jgi:hypothetical protein
VICVFYEAARLKSNYKLSLADHPELEPVEQHEQASFLWLPAKPEK